MTLDRTFHVADALAARAGPVVTTAAALSAAAA